MYKFTKPRKDEVVINFKDKYDINTNVNKEKGLKIKEIIEDLIQCGQLLGYEFICYYDYNTDSRTPIRSIRIKIGKEKTPNNWYDNCLYITLGLDRYNRLTGSYDIFHQTNKDTGPSSYGRADTWINDSALSIDSDAYINRLIKQINEMKESLKKYT